MNEQKEKWTDGDWSPTECQVYAGRLLVCDCAPYGSCTSNRFSDGEVSANAHLIAAAPELYEALLELLPLAEISTSYRAPDLVEKAKQALAKARGEG